MKQKNMKLKRLNKSLVNYIDATGVYKGLTAVFVTSLKDFFSVSILKSLATFFTKSMYIVCIRVNNFVSQSFYEKI